MPITWNIFRITCFLQMLLTTYFTFTSLIYTFREGDIEYFFHSLAFVVIASLAILGINILNTNYPDKPVAGRQKSVFNWLFLLNFLLLVFLFAMVFTELRELKALSQLTGRIIFSLPARLLVTLYLNLAILVFHLAILYGLYSLRRKLFMNFMRNREFEFEKANEA